MHYTDAPDAQNQLMNFIRLCEEHAIPCDSFQLSSGYTSINGKRYVFNWNYDKVPQPKVMSRISQCWFALGRQYQAVPVAGSPTL